MSYKQITLAGEQYYTLFLLKELKQNDVVYLWLKKTNTVVKVKCLLLPNNIISFKKLGVDEKFVFHLVDVVSHGTLDNIKKYFNEENIISVSKRLDHADMLSTTYGCWFRYSPVVILTDKPRMAFAKKLTAHQKHVLEKMKQIKEPVIASDIDTRVDVMDRLVHLGYVKEHHYDYIQDEKVGSFRKFELV